MRPWTGTLAAAALFFVACSLTQSLDPLSDRSCPAGTKACNNRCIPDNDPATGCAAAQCGPCQVANATAACTPQGQCAVARCEDGFDDCDSDPANGCEANLSTSTQHCGSCGRFCSADKATSACVDGRCAVAMCEPGYKDCNQVAADGCEVQFGTDPKHCGGCASACAPGRECVGGVCVVVTSASNGSSSRHACALLSSGKTLCWGDNTSSQLGDGQLCSKTPCAVTTASPLGLPGLRAVATGQDHTCGVTGSGLVLCWGDNSAGQLGLGAAEPTPRPTPRSIDGLSGVTDLAAGARHTCALAAGAVLCWGEGSYGQTGGGDAPAVVPSPRPVLLAGEPLKGAIALAAGARHTCAVLQGGGLLCWGDNSAGQLGDGGKSADLCVPTQQPSCAYAPVAAKSPLPLVSVACGEDATCALDKEGFPLCAGAGAQGRLGNGSEDGASSLVAVQRPDGMTPLSSLRLGNGHACALQAANGSLWCWGKNERGQLLQGLDKPFLTRPTLVGLLTSASFLAAGSDFTCAINQGSLYCVGDNSLGQLGLGGMTDTQPHPFPTRVEGLP